MKALNPQIPYSREELFRPGPPRTYRGRQLDNIAFPLGGIGTGTVSLGGWGQLRDFELFNRPAKGLTFQHTFLTLHARRGSEEPVTRVLQGPVGGVDFTHEGSGVDRSAGAGLPHFRSAEFEGAFPLARLCFDDPKMPLDVSLEAYNPFIPLNPDDSSLPVAILNVSLRNPSPGEVRAVLFASLENKVGHPEVGGGLIEAFDGAGVRGLKMSTRKHPADSPRYGTLALATPWDQVAVQTHWLRGGWFDSLERFWCRASEGELDECRDPAEVEDGTDVGSIALRAVIAPGETVRLPVWIVWHNPNFEKYWEQEEPKPTWQNHYATIHKDAATVAEYVAANEERLEAETRAFADALFSSTLPEPVLDAVSSQISILKSPTCLRLEDGTFWAWEGCCCEHGCCSGTCTHVWNYAQAMPYLFPSLERSIRNADYRVNLHEDGHMTFRMPLPLGVKPPASFHAAADGQLGGIMKVYREWLICGDDEWLRGVWPSVKRAFEYAWQQWDKDKDGMPEGVQHNTYDIEFHGPNTMMGSFYLGALRAAEQMARRLGETDKADEYRAVFESGRAKMDAELFNGEYYEQKVWPHGEPKEGLDPQGEDFPVHQYGAGCLSDHLIGQWYARMLRLGDLFDPGHARSALAAIFRHNWKSDLSEHANPQRIFGLNDERGLLLTTWPRGGRPAAPFPYCDEIWCGIEYQVAAHLIYEGLIEEGLAIVRAVRDRHTGVRRSPWNESECGNHYARSMACYSVLLALSGLFYSAPDQHLEFAPAVQEDNFACFFSVDSGWGMVRQRVGVGDRRAVVEVHRGELRLRELRLGLALAHSRVTLGGREVAASVESEEGGTLLRFEETLAIGAGQSLCVEELT